MSRAKRPNRPKAKKPRRANRVKEPLRYKKRLVSRKTKQREITIVTRKEQPMPVQLQTMKVSALARQDIPLQRVSSSWIKEIGYHAKDHVGVMTTLPKPNYPSRGYLIHNLPMRVMEGFYYAHSKGTFYNYFIKGKYNVTRYR